MNLLPPTHPSIHPPSLSGEAAGKHPEFLLSWASNHDKPPILRPLY
jgi:hypothetical protein